MNRYESESGTLIVWFVSLLCLCVIRSMCEFMDDIELGKKTFHVLMTTFLFTKIMMCVLFQRTIVHSDRRFLNLFF